MTDIPGLLRVLVRHRVDFIIVGGVAATIHGSARVTQDLDVVYDRAGDNLERLATALAGQHPYPRGAPPDLPFEWNQETLRRGLNFTLATDLGALDLLGEITGGGNFNALRPHCIEVDLYGARCLCLDLETLIHVKRATGRPRDFDAIAELRVIQEELATTDD
jgi:hypothetical protein